jgi:hypothetical protein
MAIVRPEELCKVKTFNDLIWNRTRDPPARSSASTNYGTACPQCINYLLHFMYSSDTGEKWNWTVHAIYSLEGYDSVRRETIFSLGLENP